VFLHRFQQRGLRLGRRAVDFVGEHDVREDRPRGERHLPTTGLGIFLDDVGAGDVGRHQVGRELDAVELQLQHLRQGANQQRLGETGHTDDQTVAAHKERQQDQVDGVVLAHDQFLEFGDDLPACGIHLVGQGDVVRRLHVHDCLRVYTHDDVL
jgi:hypothetical protein